MVETHTRILGIAPYDGMRTAMEQAAQAYPNVELEVYTGDLEEGQAIVQRMAPNSYDCIISRGGTATLIRQVTDLPVVDIHISVYDVMRTMKLAENYSSLYAIVGFPSITEPAHTLCSLLDFNLDILTVNNAAEVRHTLERLQQGGYRMVVCDMVTHTIAREMGFDAFLITSGVESLHAAIDQAVSISSWFGHLRQENLFLRSITQGQNGRVIVMESNGDLFYSSISEVPAELSSVLQSHIREIPASGNLRFYYTERDQLYSITAQQLLMNNVQRYLFYCVPARIPLHSSRPGLRTLNKGECEYLFANSFYSLSGAMGTQAAEIRSLALLRQPVFIYGEPGTGKELRSLFPQHQLDAFRAQGRGLCFVQGLGIALQQAHPGALPQQKTGRGLAGTPGAHHDSQFTGLDAPATIFILSHVTFLAHIVPRPARQARRTRRTRTPPAPPR